VYDCEASEADVDDEDERVRDECVIEECSLPMLRYCWCFPVTMGNRRLGILCTSDLLLLWTLC
jgi:GAF domain-containing protein